MARGGLASGGLHTAPLSMWNDWLATPWLYDLIQRHLGAWEQTSRLLRSELAGTGGLSVLDAGAGSGAKTSLVPATARYVWLDSDPAKLRGFRSRYPAAPAILGDATRLGVADAACDYTLCVAVTHHLPPEALGDLFRELARVTRRRLLFIDAVKHPSWSSRAMWLIDRGGHPHTESALRVALEASFEIEHAERYARYHHYLFCRATPRR